MKALESLLPAPVAEAIGGTLMHALWMLAALALLLMMVLVIVPRNAARLRYWLGVGTMAMMLLLPIATFAYLYEPASPVTAQTISAVQPARFSQPAKATALRPLPVMPVHITPKNGHGLMEDVSAFFQSNAYIFAGIWIAGALFFAMRFAGGYWYVRRLTRKGTSLVDSDLQTRFTALLQRMKIKRAVALLESSLIDTPMVIGVLKPVVLLPVGLMSGLSMEQVECILVHELAHVRRWDFLVNILQSIAEIMLFFHPATWWVSRMIRDERENCCDELVLRLQHNKVQYARALLSLETLRMRQPNLAMGSNGGALARRIRRITGGISPREPRNYSRGLIFGFITVACLLVLATQTRNVVKASFPDQTKPLTTPKPAPAKAANTALPVSLTSQADEADPVDAQDRFTAAIQGNLLARMAGLHGLVRMVSVAQDSPITQVIINEGQGEVIVSFDKQGQVTTATRNGQPVSEADKDRYQSMADQVMHSPVDPIPAMPPMPPMGKMGALPPMPAFAIPPIPAMPAMPPFGSKDFDEEAFERDMEVWSKKMEDWGRSFEDQFNSADWEQYGEALARMSEQVVLAAPDDASQAEIERLSEDMARVSAELEKEKDPARREELERQLSVLDEQISEVATANESRWEAWGEEMERWAERHSNEMERWAERHEEEMARHEAEMDRHERDMERERARQEAEMYRDQAHDARARMQEDREREVSRMHDATISIGEQMQEDGLIKNADVYKLKINDEDLYIDGKKQPALVYKKYARLVENGLGIELDHEWVTIDQRRNSRSISTH